MKLFLEKFAINFLTILLLLPHSVYAQTNICTHIGYSIYTINGISTDSREAAENKKALEDRLNKVYNNQPLMVDFLYNPTHTNIVDLLDSGSQHFYEEQSTNLEDYDFSQILKDASTKVVTQKLLMVGHSQGNFYANTLWDKLADEVGGVPSQSMGVYAVATPANHIAGIYNINDNNYTTSDTDQVIKAIQEYYLKANVHIDFKPNDGDSRGHSFSSIYLKYKAEKIKSDIESALSRLQDNNVQNENRPCISPPKLTLAQKTQGVIVLGVDGTVYVADKTVKGIQNGYLAFINKTGEILADAFNGVNGTKVNNGAVAVESGNQDPPAGQVSEPPPTTTSNQIAPPPQVTPKSNTTTQNEKAITTKTSIPLNSTIPNNISLLSSGISTTSLSTPGPSSYAATSVSPQSEPNLKENSSSDPPATSPSSASPPPAPPISPEPPLISNIVYSQLDDSVEIPFPSIATTFTGKAGKIQGIKFAYNDKGNGPGHFLAVSVVDLTTAINYFACDDLYNEPSHNGDIYESMGSNSKVIVEYDSSVHFKESLCTGSELVLDPTHTYSVSISRNHGGNDNQRFYGSSDANDSAYLYITNDALPSTGKSIKSLKIPHLGAVGGIDEANHTISFDVPAGTDISLLTPIIRISGGATVSPASGQSVDFTNAVIYTVTAEDGLTQTYTMTAHINSNVVYSQPDDSILMDAKTTGLKPSIKQASGTISQLKFAYNDMGNTSGHFLGLEIYDFNSGKYYLTSLNDICGDVYESTGTNDKTIVTLDSTVVYREFPCTGENLHMDPAHIYGVGLFRNHGGFDTQQFYGSGDAQYLYVETTP